MTDNFYHWMESHSMSDEQIDGFPFGGWRSPDSYVSSTVDDPALVKWAWIKEHCPDGQGIDYKTQRIVRRSPFHKGKPLRVCYNYIWFADAITATLYRIRFGA